MPPYLFTKQFFGIAEIESTPSEPKSDMLPLHNIPSKKQEPNSNRQRLDYDSITLPLSYPVCLL